MDKGYRLHQDKRAKAKAKRKLLRDGAEFITPKRVGKYAAVHGTCDCWMCKMKDKDHGPSLFKGGFDDTHAR